MLVFEKTDDCVVDVWFEAPLTQGKIPLGSIDEHNNFRPCVDKWHEAEPLNLDEMEEIVSYMKGKRKE